MQEYNPLTCLNLNQNSANILSCLLKEGDQTASSIGRKIGVSRLTVVKILKELSERGFVKKKSDSYIWEAESEESLLKLNQEAQEKGESYLRDLLIKRNKRNEIPEISFRQGPLAISSVYHELATILPKGATYYRYTSRIDNTIRSEAYRTLRESKEFERLVITSSEKAKTKGKDSNRFIKTVPKDFAFDDNVSLIIYGDRVSLFDHSTESAVTIQSKQLARFQEKIFKLLWKRL